MGKTTTVAKLAAKHLIELGKSVALITSDTYRIGAVEQLAAYARILGAPLDVAICPEDIASLVKAHRDKDLIIIDSVGRSQRDTNHLSELGRFIRAAQPTEVHLAVSASSSLAAQREALTSFGLLGPDRLIVTKLDESPTPGCMAELCSVSLLGISYVTFGQEVPDDIAVAQGDHLAHLILEGVR